MHASLPKLKVALIIPVYNAANYIEPLFTAIFQQTLKPDHLLVIDSSSTDNTKALLESLPIQLHTIPQQEFDHGGTRKLATQLVDADIYLFMTQDAIPADPHTFANLINIFHKDATIGCAYGRQRPKTDANPLSAHARYFNYPSSTQIKRYSDRKKLGIKTCFNSDSFAAYRREALLAVGNFPEHLITGEDAYIAGKLLMHDYAVAYVSEACVYHSHNLSLKQEFHRYFSIGVFHGREKWLLETFDSATGEGIRFVRSELKFLLRNHYSLWLPRAVLSTLIKYLGYKLGLHEKAIPLSWKKTMGINQAYWQKQPILTYDND